jgi:hypothetical protein
VQTRPIMRTVQVRHLNVIAAEAVLAARTARRATVGVAAMALLALGSAGVAQASGAPGWRVVATVASSQGRSSLITVAATGPRDAWAAGAVYPARGRARPLAEHWTGRSWSVSTLPKGVSGTITIVRGSSPGNVWAFDENDLAKTETALRWSGRRWTVAKQWPASARMLLADALVFGRDNVWVFSRQQATAERYNGHTWSEKMGPLPPATTFMSVTAASADDIWIMATTRSSNGYTSYAINGNGANNWFIGGFPGFPAAPSPGPITYIYTLSATDIWAVGGSNWGSGPVPIAAHYDGKSWTPFEWTRLDFILTAALPDGSGGLWVTTGWASTGIPPHLLHYAGGAFTPVSLPRIHGQYVDVTALTAIPRSSSAWAVGKLTRLHGTGPATGVILKHGT